MLKAVYLIYWLILPFLIVKEGIWLLSLLISLRRCKMLEASKG
jgi:hypothetical protein